VPQALLLISMLCFEYVVLVFCLLSNICSSCRVLSYSCAMRTSQVTMGIEKILGETHSRNEAMENYPSQDQQRQF
jgi:hypothetical protein